MKGNFNVEMALATVRELYPEATRIRGKKHHRSFYRFQVIQRFGPFSVAANVHVYSADLQWIVSTTMRVSKTELVSPEKAASRADMRRQERNLDKALKLLVWSWGKTITAMEPW